MIEQLREELEVDEGCMYSVYLDHLGYKTVGIGHLCKRNDPERDMEVGTSISEERVKELFEGDIAQTIKDCYKLIPDWDMLPEEVQLICANMCFNLGINRFGRFEKFIAAIENRDWGTAAHEMEDSKWCKQVPERSGRLIMRMQKGVEK